MTSWRPEYFYSGDVPLFWLGVWWLLLELTGTSRWARQKLLRYLFRHKNLTKRAPLPVAMRHYVEPPTPSEVAAMADDETHRITSSQWPPPYIDPPATIASPGPGQGFPGHGKPRPDRRGLVVGLVALAATVLVGAVGIGAYLLGHQSSGPKAQTVNVPAAAASSSPATKSMAGTVTMPRYSTPHLAGDSPNWEMDKIGACSGVGGYSDMTAGASVTVYDASGTIIGSSGLVFGTRHGNTCEWQFGVNDLPDVPFYQVEVSHRGKITVANEDLGRVAMSLGD